MNLLFNGPGAKSSALADARTRGKLNGPSIGESGLKVDDARELIESLSMPLPGKSKKAVVAGPMDLANVNSSDALLKTLEDLDHSKYVLNLWAMDSMNVSPTIQSRCTARWCPEAKEEDLGDDEETYPKAMELLEAYRQKDYLTIVDIAKDKDKSKLEAAFRLLPDVLSPHLVEDSNERDLVLWGRIRATLKYSNISRNEILAVMLS